MTSGVYHANMTGAIGHISTPPPLDLSRFVDTLNGSAARCPTCHALEFSLHPSLR